MEPYAKYAFIAIFVAAIPVWFACVYNYIRMIGQVRYGNYMALMFNPFWWLPKNAGKYLTDRGMVYHRRAAWLMGAFMVLVLAGIVSGMAMTLANL